MRRICNKSGPVQTPNYLDLINAFYEKCKLNTLYALNVINSVLYTVDCIFHLAEFYLHHAKNNIKGLL